MRGAAVALAGVLCGLVVTWVALERRAGVAWEMDRDFPAFVSGVHPAERDKDMTFAWTTGAARFRLEGASREAPWTCVVRLRGGRPDGWPQPLVQVGADGLVTAAFTATNTYQDVTVPVPARPGRDGLVLTIAAEPVMVPGPSDPRQLGVQIDRIACQPESWGLSMIPPRPLVVGSATAAAFGAASLWLGVGVPAALAMTAGLAIAQAHPLSTSFGPYSSYPGTVAWLGLFVTLILAGVGGIARWRDRPMAQPAAAAAAFTAAAALLELDGLLHPAKLIIDAVFQAHRLEWVLDGRYLFTQVMPSGVRFPYAIALYVVAAPWTAITSDYVTLLRVVVVVVRAGAAIAMYPLVRRAGGDRVTAALSTALVYLVPLPYLNIGNANLTFVFGQAAAMFALAAAVAWRLERPLALAGLFALCSLAFLSHVGVFPVLLVTLLVLAVLYWWSGRSSRRAAVGLAVAALCAAVFSVAIYYGHFAEAYQSLERVKARAASIASPSGEGTVQPTTTSSRPGLPLRARAVNAVLHGVRAIGWPLVALATLGAWRAWQLGSRDRAVLAAAAVTLACLVFLASAVAAPVEPRFQRYTDEFVDRLSYFALPAAVLLAARGAAWLRSAGRGWHVLSWALLSAAAWEVARQWMGWLE